MEIEALSVSVEDADADTEHEEALWGEPGMPVAREAWQRSTIKSLFPSEAEALEAVTLILAQAAYAVVCYHLFDVWGDWIRPYR